MGDFVNLILLLPLALLNSFSSDAFGSNVEYVEDTSATTVQPATGVTLSKVELHVKSGITGTPIQGCHAAIAQTDDYALTDADGVLAGALPVGSYSQRMCSNMQGSTDVDFEVKPGMKTIINLELGKFGNTGAFSS